MLAFEKKVSVFFEKNILLIALITALIVSVIVSLFVPIVFINSSLWGQCDAIYSSFAIWSLYAFAKRNIPYLSSYTGLVLSQKSMTESSTAEA